jgi:hypothetical protein
MARQLSLPIIIVFDGIAVRGLVFAAMDAEVGLAVAIQIALPQSNATIDALLEDSGRHDFSVPGHFSREPDTDGYELHVVVDLSVCVRSAVSAIRYRIREFSRTLLRK